MVAEESLLEEVIASATLTVDYGWPKLTCPVAGSVIIAGANLIR